VFGQVSTFFTACGASRISQKPLPMLSVQCPASNIQHPLSSCPNVRFLAMGLELELECLPLKRCWLAIFCLVLLILISASLLFSFFHLRLCSCPLSPPFLFLVDQSESPTRPIRVPIPNPIPISVPNAEIPGYRDPEIQGQAIPYHIFALTPVRSRFFALGVYRLSTLSKKRDIKAYIMSAADAGPGIPVLFFFSTSFFEPGDCICILPLSLCRES